MDLLCVFFMSLPLCASVYMRLVVTIGILGQVWYLIVSIPDLCTLTYFRAYTKRNGYGV